MYSRAKSATQFNTPGPGAYRNENVTASWKAAPKYSLSARSKSGSSTKSPGILAARTQETQLYPLGEKV